VTRVLKAPSNNFAYFSCWYLSWGGKILRNLPQLRSSYSVLALSLLILANKSFYRSSMRNIDYKVMQG